jgi:hypothetical protein
MAQGHVFNYCMFNKKKRVASNPFPYTVPTSICIHLWKGNTFVLQKIVLHFPFSRQVGTPGPDRKSSGIFFTKCSK